MISAHSCFTLCYYSGSAFQLFLSKLNIFLHLALQLVYLLSSLPIPLLHRLLYLPERLALLEHAKRQVPQLLVKQLRFRRLG